MQVVYVDVLLLLNFFLTWILLSLTSHINKTDRNQLRLLLGSIFGSISSLLILLPPLNWAIQLLIKILLSILLISLSFQIKTRREFFRIVLSFFVVNFLLAGMIVGIQMLTKSDFFIYQNGALYFDVNLLQLIIAFLITYVVIRLLIRLFQRKTQEKFLCEVVLKVDDMEIRMNALYDSGNDLRDSFSNLPVIVAELPALKGYIPQEAYSYLKNGGIPPDVWGKYWRIIPFKSIGSNGMMRGFKADSVLVIHRQSSKLYAPIVVAVSSQNLSSGTYCALLHSSMNDIQEEK